MPAYSNLNVSLPDRVKTDSRVTVYGLSASFDKWFDTYQAYYAQGLRGYLHNLGGFYVSFDVAKQPRLLSAISLTLNSNIFIRTVGRFSPVKELVARGFSRIVEGQRSFSGTFQSLTGQYLFYGEDSIPIKFCIDAHDSGTCVAPDLLEWADIYFKTNLWSSKQYPKNVRPLVNGNPTILPHHQHLQQLRKTEKIYDLAFVVRVWGGADEVSGIEHNLKLLEAIAQVPGKHCLIAYLVAGDIPHIRRRLEKIGIKCVTRPVPLYDLWSIAASSRFNIIRLGMHDCIPWRMIDLLAMGSAILLDRRPFTVWPVPLVEDKHFSVILPEDPSTVLFKDLDYDNIANRLTDFLNNQDFERGLRRGAQDYFDQHANPENVAKTIIDELIGLHRPSHKAHFTSRTAANISSDPLRI